MMNRFFFGMDKVHFTKDPGMRTWNKTKQIVKKITIGTSIGTGMGLLYASHRDSDRWAWPNYRDRYFQALADHVTRSRNKGTHDYWIPFGGVIGGSFGLAFQLSPVKGPLFIGGLLVSGRAYMWLKQSTCFHQNGGAGACYYCGSEQCK
jgi:hypothetical protein